MNEDDDARKVPPAQLPFLEVLWASQQPLAPIDILERVNALRRNAKQVETDENNTKATLKKMRDAKLIEVVRPTAAGDYVVVKGKALEDALKTRDGKTRYQAAIRPEQVETNTRKPRPTDETASQIWQNHAKYVEAMVTRPIFRGDVESNGQDDVEPYSLRDIYVEPKAYRIVDDQVSEQTGLRHQTREVVDLMKELTEWVESSEVEYSTLILSGSAGCGKSSFARMLANRLMPSGPLNIDAPHVLYVPLQNMPVTTAPRQALSLIAKEYGYPPDVLNPLGPTDRKIVLIFDGLDELAKQGDSGEKAAQVFAKGVADAVDNCRKQGRQMLVLLCGRPVAAQHASLHAQDPRQLYHLVPFLPPKEDDKRLKIKYTGESITDQRDAWWAKYKTAYNDKKPAGAKPEPDTIPDVLLDEKLEEFTAQPLLMLLLAITYRGHLDEIDPGKIGGQKLPPNPFRVEKGKTLIPERMADLYAFLLGRIYYRDMKRKGYSRTADGTPPIEYRQFRDLLGVLGLAAWHTGSSRVATVEAVEKLCTLLGLEDTLNTYKEAYRVDTVALFVAFYFKHVNRLQDGKETFEFTVKPFAEALAASGLASAIWDIVSRYGQKKQARNNAKWTPKELLLEWLQLTGPGELTRELHQNLTEEIARRVEQGEEPELGKKGREVLRELLAAIQPRTITLAEFEDASQPTPPLLVGMKKADLQFPVLVGSFPAEANELKDLSHLHRVQWCNRAEYTLLTALGACDATVKSPTWQELAKTDPLPVLPGWDSVYERDANYHQWIKDNTAWMDRHPNCFLRFHWPTPTSAAELFRRVRPARDRFDSLDSSPPPLILDHWDLSHQCLLFCDLSYASLVGASLVEARLVGARLVGARLVGARLVGASLVEASLVEASLVEASLVEARLDGANLVDASLVGASLAGASLVRTRLTGANLAGANLDGANLDGADFSKAILIHATYHGKRLDTVEGRKLLLSKGAIV